MGHLTPVISENPGAHRGDVSGVCRCACSGPPTVYPGDRLLMNGYPESETSIRSLFTLCFDHLLEFNDALSELFGLRLKFFDSFF